MSLKIFGVLHLTSPMQVITPGAEAKLSARTGRVVYGDENQAFPLTQTSAVPVLIEGARKSFPVIPPNTLRGGLRRAAADLILHSFRRRRITLTLAAWQGLRAGAVHGHPDGADPSVSEFEAAMQHPYLGLFGGSAKMVPSKLRLDTGWPVTQALVDAGIIPAGCDRGVIPADRPLLGYQWQRRVDDGLNMTSLDQLAAVVTDPLDMIDAWQTLFSRPSAEDKEAARSSDEGKLTGLKSLTAVEFVMAGVPMVYNAETSGSSAAQDGLLLLAVRSFVRTQRIGASTRHGFGRFLPELRVMADGFSGELLTRIADDASNEFDFSPMARDALGDRIQAAEQAIEAMEGRSIEQLFQSSETAKETLRKKCKTPDSQAAFKTLFG